MRVNERFIWAATILDIKPDDQLLEIGCGTGLMAEQIANQLRSGCVTAIDRSAGMVKMAANRNAQSISIGKVNLTTMDFLNSDFKKSRFDKVVAFNVNFFWKKPEKEFQIIRKILKPMGELYFYQPPFAVKIKAADPIKERLIINSFEILDTIFKRMVPHPALCVKASPKAE